MDDHHEVGFAGTRVALGHATLCGHRTLKRPYGLRVFPLKHDVHDEGQTKPGWIDDRDIGNDHACCPQRCKSPAHGRRRQVHPLADGGMTELIILLHDREYSVIKRIRGE